MSLHKTPAITLRSRKWGEADRIVTFYTLHFGKLRAVARGARRIKSRFGGALEPFIQCDLNLFEKHGDSLSRVTQVDIRESFQGLREDLRLMVSAARMVNLLSAVTVENDPDPGIYETLLQGLRALHSGSDPALTTVLFQIRLLGQTGFRPQTDQCAVCGNTQGIEVARFSPRSGGLICEPCAERQPGACLFLSRASWAVLRQASRMAPSLLCRLKATAGIRRELETAIESFLWVVAYARLPPVDFLAAENSAPVYGLGHTLKR